MAPALSPPRVHHVGIETADLANSLAWYEAFFGCRPTWSADRFSPVTVERLPGVVCIAELALGDLRFHLIERPGGGDRSPAGDGTRFQHVCLAAASPDELDGWRQRWLDLYGSGRFTFARPEPPTRIVVDEKGTGSFYCLDVNGLEFEFTHTPENGPESAR